MGVASVAAAGGVTLAIECSPLALRAEIRLAERDDYTELPGDIDVNYFLGGFSCELSTSSVRAGMW